MSETKVFHQLKLMYNLKQDVDYIVRQLNQQNRLISRMRRFQRYCKDFLEGTNQIGLKRLDLEYTKFDRDYRHLNRVCKKMNRKLNASLVYDKISNLFVSLSEDCSEIDDGGGQVADKKVDVDDNFDGDDEIENDDISDLLTELDSDEFDEYSSDVSVVKRNKEDTFVEAQQSTPINKNVMKGLENVAVGSKGNKSDESEKMLKCDIKGCQFVTKWQYNVTRHKLNIHKISNQRQLSNLNRQDSPTSKSENSSKQTPKQQALYRCDFGAGCTYVTNQSRYLKQHQRIHTTKQLNCDYDGCDFHTTQPGTLVYHQRRIHNRFHCGYTECRYVGKRESDLKVHRTKMHKDSEKEHRCPVGGCEFVTRIRYDLLRHEMEHIAENTIKSTSSKSPQPSKVFRCNYPGCQYSTNSQNKLFDHRVTHNTFKCSHRDCSYAGKRLVDLKVHQTKMHSKLK